MMNPKVQIIQHDAGALLVMASAGSGKTRVLTERVRTLLSKPGSRAQMLVLTFTNKAAEELKERLGNIADLEKRAFVGTFHGFCLDVLEKHCYAIGLRTVPHIYERNEDRVQLLMQVLEMPENWNLRNAYEKKESSSKRKQFIDNALGYISEQKKQLKGVKQFEHLDVHLEHASVQQMYNGYNELLRLENAMDFDDVLLMAYKIFEERPAIAKLYRKQYGYIMVDEAQDLNMAQYELLKIICADEHRNVMMVGDVKQSLYNFNGAHIKYMSEYFKKDFAPEEYYMEMNYRSSQKIVELANSLFPNSKSVSDSNFKGQFRILGDCANEQEEAQRVVSEIERILANGKYTEEGIEEGLAPSDIAVLARNKYLLNHVEKELKLRDIDYSMKKMNGTMGYDSTWMQIFDLGLRVLINPVGLLHYGELHKCYGITLEEQRLDKPTSGIIKLREVLPLVPPHEKQGYEWLLEAWEALERQQRFDLGEAIRLLRQRINNTREAQEPAVAYANTQELPYWSEVLAILSDLNELESFWKLYARNTSSELKSLSHFKTQVSLGAIMPQKAEDGVVLSTIHLSKGLEYKIVFVVGMDDSSLPYYRSVQSGGTVLKEEKNIFYVAVTRAGRALYLSYPKVREMPWGGEKKQEPSRYLKEINELENK